MIQYVEEIEMKVDIYYFNQRFHDKDKVVHDLVPTHLGYVEVERFNAEEIFDLCNWSNWTEEKPINLHADIKSCGHGLCLVNPETQQKWLALTIGWLIGDSEEISDYVRENKNNIIWS